MSRARQSLGTRSSSSLAHSREQTPDRSPLFKDNNSRERWKLSIGKKRQGNALKSSGNTAGHLRMSSDTVLSDRKDIARGFPRSSSASGTSRTTNLQEDENGERSSPLGRSVGSGDSKRRFLDPLREDEPMDTTTDMSPLRELSPFTDDSPPPVKPNRTSSQRSYFDYKKPAPNELTRSRSTIQLRDLREQMQDLKGKITSLKQRTREDSLQRRSLQTLKTPSPFTVAPGYEDEEEQKKTSSKSNDIMTDIATTKAHPIGMVEAEDHLGEDDDSPERSDISEALMRSNSNKEYYALDYLQQTHTTNLPDHVSDDNLDTPLESPDEPYSPDPEEEPIITGTRHEDRPDAFDYEHFFLHSGMGALQRSDMKRRDTMSSSDSAETTKPSATTIEGEESVSSVSSPGEMSPAQSSSPSSAKESPPSVQNPAFQKNSNYMHTHFHHGSIDSISTVGTFATATENHHHNDFLNPNGIRSQSSASSRSKSPNAFHSASVSPVTSNQAQFQHPPFAAMHQNTSPATYQQTLTSTNSYGVPTFQQAPPPANNYYQHQPLSPLQSHPPSSGASNGHFRNTSVPTTPAVIIPTLPQLSTADQRLVQDLLHSLTKACAHLNLEKGEDEESESRRKGWKRRIDAARRILEGGEGTGV